MSPDEFVEAVREDLWSLPLAKRDPELVGLHVESAELLAGMLERGATAELVYETAQIIENAAARSQVLETTQGPPSRKQRSSSQKASSDVFSFNDLIRTLVTLTPFSRNDLGERFLPAEADGLSFVFGELISKRALESLRDEISSFMETSPQRPMDILRRIVVNWSDDVLYEPIGALSATTEPPLSHSVHADIPTTVANRLSRDALDDATRTKREIDSIKAEVDQAKREILELKNNAETATGVVGEIELTRDFVVAELAAESRAKIWTRGVFSFAAAGILIPLIALSEGPVAFGSLHDVLAVVLKVAIGLPLFALAAYCGHIAAQHRETARHMTILVAQLKSVSAYTANLPEPSRDRIRLLLGERAFSDPGLILHDKGRVTAMPDDAAEIIKRAMELLASQKP